MEEFDKILNDYITAHYNKFNFCFINCEFKVELDYNFTSNVENKYFHSMDIKDIKKQLLYYNDCFKSRGYKFYNINQMTINSINDRSNMTYRG